MVFHDGALGDLASAAPFASAPPARVSAAAPARPPVRAVPVADPANLGALLSAYGTVGRAVLPATGGRWIIQIQDVHGNPTAQKNAESAIERLFASRAADALVLEGQTRPLDPALFQGAPDVATRDAAADALFAEGRISGAAHLIVTRPGAVPAVRPLEDDSAYRANVTALREALGLQPAALAALDHLDQSLAVQKKRHYNAEMYVIDLALLRYDSGGMPLTSLLALLRHRGEELTYVTSALLRANALENLYNVSEVGTELRALLGRLRGRISDADASVLFDAAFRFQKGKTGTADFVSTLMTVTSRNGISLNDFPNLSTHLERTLVTRAIDPEKIIAAVEEIESGLPARLAVTAEEKDVARVARRLALLRKLARLSLSSREWTELLSPMPVAESGEPEVLALVRRCRILERALSPAKNFYRRASLRNDSFLRHLTAERDAGAQRLLVVAGGFHTGAIVEAARKIGFGYVAFTPLVGDARGWDASAPLRDLARAPSDVDAALEAQAQTLTARPLSSGDHARIAAAVIARGTLDGNPRSIQWGRDQLGYLKAALGAVTVNRDASGATVTVNIDAGGRPQAIDIRLTARELRFMTVTRPFRRFFGGTSRWIQRQYYRRAGVPIRGKGLHTSKPVNVRFVPRPTGSGINFFRRDVKAVSEEQRVIPAILGFLGRNRSRYTGIESNGLQISMVEHLLFAMRSLDIWDADIYVDSEEMPILDGSAGRYIDALSLFEGWSPKPPELRLEEPVVFWRDENTMILMLPLEEGEADSEYGFALNFPKVQTQPVEFRMTVNDNDLGAARAAVGRNPTFLEKPIEELRRLGFFRGGEPYKPGQASNPNRAKDDPKGSVVMVNDPADWKNGNIDVEGLARHKVMDVMGDEMILLKTIGRRLKARTIAFGTGHRDTAEAMLMVEMLRGGYHFPFYYDRVAGNLDKLLADGKLSRQMHDYVMSKIAKYKDYDAGFVDAPHLPRTSVPQAEIRRLEAAFTWESGANPMRERAMRGISAYLFRSEGSALALVADRIAKPQFRPEEIFRLEARVTEELAHAIVCEVTFVLAGVSPLDYPRVAMVVAKPDGENETEQLFYAMKTATDKAPVPSSEREIAAARAGDRSVNYFPVVGPYKSGVFARQWLARSFAHFRPMVYPSEAARYRGRLPFGLVWDGDGGRLRGAPPDEMRRRDVAKATASMLTAAFLRLRSVRPSALRGEQVPMTGQFVDGFDLTSDLLFDPIDGRAALAFLRGTQMMSAEDFLNEVLHLSYAVESVRNVAGQPALRVEKRWQPFSADVASVLTGVEQTLVEEYGPIKGRAGAIAWYERYLERLDSASETPAGLRFRRTEVYRNLALNEGGAEAAAIEETWGVPIAPEVRVRMAALKREIEAESAKAVIVSLAKGLAWLTGFPPAVWARLAPVTEGLLFAALGGAAVAAVGAVAGGVAVPGLISAVIGMAVWRVGHRTVLVTVGEAAVEVPFEDLSAIGKARVVGMGLLVAALPAVGFAFGPLAGTAASLIGLVVHTAANAGLAGRPLRFLDGSQRGMAALQRQV